MYKIFKKKINQKYLFIKNKFLKQQFASFCNNKYKNNNLSELIFLSKKRTYFFRVFLDYVWWWWWWWLSQWCLWWWWWWWLWYWTLVMMMMMMMSNGILWLCFFLAIIAIFLLVFENKNHNVVSTWDRSLECCLSLLMMQMMIPDAVIFYMDFYYVCRLLHFCRAWRCLLWCRLLQCPDAITS